MPADLALYSSPTSRGRIARWMPEEVGEPRDARMLGYGSPDPKGMKSETFV